MLPLELDWLCQKAKSLKFPGLPAKGNLYEVLHFLATELEKPIDSEGCQAVCKQLGLDWESEILANPTLTLGVLLPAKKWMSYGHWNPLKVPPQVATLQRISLPLDPRKGGVIRLSEEQAQVAMSPAPVAAERSQLLTQSVMWSQMGGIQSPKWEKLLESKTPLLTILEKK